MSRARFLGMVLIAGCSTPSQPTPQPVRSPAEDAPAVASASATAPDTHPAPMPDSHPAPAPPTEAECAATAASIRDNLQQLAANAQNQVAVMWLMSVVELPPASEDASELDGNSGPVIRLGKDGGGALHDWHGVPLAEFSAREIRGALRRELAKLAADAQQYVDRGYISGDLVIYVAAHEATPPQRLQRVLEVIPALYHPRQLVERPATGLQLPPRAPSWVREVHAEVVASTDGSGFERLRDALVRAIGTCQPLAEALGRVAESDASGKSGLLAEAVSVGLLECACTGVEIHAVEALVMMTLWVEPKLAWRELGRP
jgi:hypothetical protein